MNTESSDNRSVSQAVNGTLPTWLQLVRRQVETLKFGTVQVTVHDAQVTQVERLEKLRLDRPKTAIPKTGSPEFKY